MSSHLLAQTVPQAVADLARYYTTGQKPGAHQGEPAVDPLVMRTAEAAARGTMTDDAAFELVRSAAPSGTSVRDDFDRAVAWQRAKIDGSLAPGAEIRRDMHPLAARGLGVSARQTLTRDQINGLLGGRGADGRLIAGKQYAKLRTVTDPRTGKAKDLVPIGSYDFCLTPDKSVSVAWAFAKPAEQAAIYNAHREAGHEAMRYLEERIGQARVGRNGNGGSEPGHIGWMAFDHYTSRPTLWIARDEKGQRVTESVPVMVAGDPDLHTHYTVPNAVFCPSGRIGSLDTAQMDGLVKEAGAYYQAHVATNLRRLGAEVALDPETGMARMTAIPSEVRDHFSKKTRNGEEAARDYARAQGLDWDALAPDRRVGLLKSGTQGSINAAPNAATRGKLRKDDMADFTAWRTQAGGLGWQYQGISGPSMTPAEQAPRIERAYHESLPWIEKELNSRAVVTGPDVRTAALRGLIATGITGPEDISRVTATFVSDGVRQYGAQTALMYAEEEVNGRQRVSITTVLHVDHEREFIALAKAGAADTSDALSPRALQQAIKATGVSLSAEQTDAVERLAHGGKVGVVVGVAGAGKTYLLKPLVAAWNGQGRDVHGLALAWRQADDLTDAGIDKSRVKALSVFMTAAGKGEVELTPKSVVVVDELSLLGTRQGLELLRLQEKMGFRLAMIGDDKQCTSIEAGPIIDLARKALGPGQVPEILTTVRQQTQHERKVTALFRDGKADAALKLKRQDGSAELVPGGYREATERVASLAADRLRANAHDPTFTLTASAPTNADAHKLGLAIRAQRRAMGQVGADAVTVRAVNGAGNAYTMPIAPGDQVRLFANTRAEGMRRAIGRNGDVLTVLAADAKGMQVRNNKNGNEGRVAWTRLTDRSGRVQLAYGDVMTTHTAQGSTATEHIYALPGGSQAITGFSAYSSGTRHRRASYIILSEGAERAGVAKTRPLNDVRPITHDAIWSTVADNLGRQPTKEMATAMTERVGGLRLGSVRSWHRAAIVAEHGQQHGMSRPTAMQTAEVNRLRRLVEPMARAVDRAVNAARSTVQHVSRVLHSAAPQQQHQQQARTRTRGMSM